MFDIGCPAGFGAWTIAILAVRPTHRRYNQSTWTFHHYADARVFNLSLKEGVVPFEWKEANIISLFKKGSRNKSENYRPVSLTSVICKLLEMLIKDHMVDFLVKHKLLNSSQHGFLKARSCLTNMLCFFGKNH